MGSKCRDVDDYWKGPTESGISGTGSGGNAKRGRAAWMRDRYRIWFWFNFKMPTSFFSKLLFFLAALHSFLSFIEKICPNFSDLHEASLVLHNLTYLFTILPKSSSNCLFIFSTMLWYCPLVLPPSTCLLLCMQIIWHSFSKHTCINFSFINICIPPLIIRRGGRRGNDKPERKGRKMPLTIVYVWRRNEAESLADYLVRVFQRSKEGIQSHLFTWK